MSSSILINQHGYTMVEGLYSRTIRNMKFYGGSQDLQYIHALLMYPEFRLMENIMPQMMRKLYQILNMSKVYPATSTLTESMIGA